MVRGRVVIRVKLVVLTAVGPPGLSTARKACAAEHTKHRVCTEIGKQNSRARLFKTNDVVS